MRGIIFNRRDGTQFLYMPDIQAAVDEDGVHYVDFDPETFIRDSGDGQLIDVPEPIAKIFKAMYYRRFKTAPVSTTVQASSVTAPNIRQTTVPMSTTVNQLSPLSYIPRQ